MRWRKLNGGDERSERKCSNDSKVNFLVARPFCAGFINLLLLPAATASGIANLQDVCQIDPDNSVATLSLGSGADTLRVGLARIGGQVVGQTRASIREGLNGFVPVVSPDREKATIALDLMVGQVPASELGSQKASRSRQCWAH
jgi:hypothetical protein